MQVEFERFPFSITGLGAEADGTVIGRDTFVPTKRVEKIIKKEEEELPPPPPTFSEAELEQAKEEAYRKGFNDGENKGKSWADSEIAKTEQAALELTPKIIEHAAELFERYNQFATEQKEAALQLSLTIAKKITNSLPDEHFFEQVAQHTIKCTEKMLGEPEIHIYVHPTLSDKMEQRLASHFASSHEPGDVIIHSEATLELFDCRIEWASGGMEYKHGSVQKQLEEIIEDFSQSIASQPPKQETPQVTPENAEAAINEQQDKASTDGDVPTQPETIEEDVPVNDAVANAIASQLADDNIPPIPELPTDGGDHTTPPPSEVNTPTSNEGENHE